jgi:deoxycytidylate deaminase
MISNKLQKFIELANQASTKTNMSTRIGACVISHNKAISIGWNDNIRSAMNRRYVPSIHAEVDAIRDYVQRKLRENRKDL